MLLRFSAQSVQSITRGSSSKRKLNPPFERRLKVALRHRRRRFANVRFAPRATVQSGFQAKLSSVTLRLEGYVAVLSQRWCASRSRSQFLGVFAAAASWYAGRDLVRSK